MDKIKVMIIDDSAVMRQYLSEIINRSRDMEVVGTAIDPIIAVNKINKLQPDVITLDIEMPRMDGITFLSKLMIARPTPVIMVSSLTMAGAKETMRALEMGAVDFITKPDGDSAGKHGEFEEQLQEKIRAAKVSHVRPKNIPAMKVDDKHTADVILQKKDPLKVKARSETVVVIGASTGGTEVLYEILTNLPEDLPGIVIAQHMPEKFTMAFAQRVNEHSRYHVKEGAHGDRLYRGVALIAPGGRHMLLHSDKESYWVEVNDGPPVNRHRPSVDVLFRSASQSAGRYASGIICTGMGNDGAAGLLEMKEAGAYCIGQNEESSVVYGMPREAFLLGAVHEERDIAGIIDYIKSLDK